MAYALHIERKLRGISIDEWLQAVASIPGLRQTDAPAIVLNPLTGESIAVPSAKGTVEVLAEDGEWFTAFHFAYDRISFKATVGIESVSDATHVAAKALAEKLGAQIVGDEDEVYNW